MPLSTLFSAFKHRSEKDELMEHPSVSQPEFIRALKEIRWVNRRLGGSGVMLDALKAILPTNAMRQQTLFRILDLGTGSGDIPMAIIRWGRTSGVKFHITALDVHPLAVETTELLTREYPEIDAVQGDALNLPYEVNQFDFVISSMFMHHLTQSEAVILLQTMARLGRLGFIINDLERHPLAWLGIRAVGLLVGNGRIFKNDAPLSVLRGFTRSELLSLCKVAGLETAHIEHRHPYRWLVMGQNTVEGVH